MRIAVVGIGMGPQHVTPEAAAVLRASSYVVCADKGADAGDDPLLDVRRAVAAAHGLEVVAVADPPRDRAPSDYVGEVRDWHDARAAAWGRAITERGGDPALLAWGDPALYDSTVRIVDRVAERVGAEVQVVAGVTAPSLLAARSGVVLHEVGQPVHVTTARRLPEAVASGQRNVVVMLSAPGDLAPDGVLRGLGGWTIWWGANLGHPSEALVHGTLDEVHGEVLAARERARAEAGWVMDVYLLRAPDVVR